MRTLRWLCAVTLLLAVFTPRDANAFCGFYVSGGGGQLFNDASMVVLVHDGTRTVLSMQNNYRGPPEDFALVVPVPVVLQKDQVKTIPKEAFTRLDELTAPRLVEVPREPCGMGLGVMGVGAGGGGMALAGSADMPRDLGVKIEAKFDVEEYEILILSAKDSLGLEIWLKEEKYKIPDGAQAALAPYVQQGSKFFVAKVNAKKAKMVDGHAVLSPLRFHYDSEQFSLPVRLGLLNSNGAQDLIVTVIAKSRYELANLKNVLVPTNVDVRTRTQPQFGGFYRELLDRTFKKYPRAAVTEFAWQGALPPPTEMVGGGIYGVTCDPCPPPHPVDNPLAKYLGVNLLPKIKTDEGIAAFAAAATVTRLHLRYTKETAPDDLVFKAADPVAGGVPEVKVAGPAKTNRFQGRYVMWVDGCGGGLLGGNGFFTPGNPLAPVTGPSAPSGNKLIDPFEQLIVSDLTELEVKAVPLAKDAPKVTFTAPPPPPQVTYVSSGGPRVQFGGVQTTEGYDTVIVTRVMKMNQNQLKYCYARALNLNPTLAGKLMLRFEVGEEGRVTKSEVLTSTVASDDVTACVTTRTRVWQFPKPAGAPAVVTVPIVFTPQ
ncbi:MAG: DUF2330 domain-containing protein [Myxococcaceae bacterium]